MCGRYALVSNIIKIQESFHIKNITLDYRPNWNITPGHVIPAVIFQNNGNQLVNFKWGFVPSFSRHPALTMKIINARAETVDKKPMFREAFRRRRCLIVADGFYEWKNDAKDKTAMYFYLKTGEPFGFAGLYETGTSPDQTILPSCLIITTQANELITPIHNRMPVILSKEKMQVWLEYSQSDTKHLLSILQPYPASEMKCKEGIGPYNI